MTVKQTDRAQITAFGQRGIELFNQIEMQLKTLVTNVADVNYHGTNAVEFKTACSNYSVDFANTCNTNMTNISESITAAATYIADALGGDRIDLEPPEVKVESPAISTDTSVETAEDGPLITLRGTVESTFNDIEASFTENLNNFQNLGADGWIGPEYDAARDDVTAITTKAVEEITISRTTIVNAINGQLQALGMGG